MTDWLEDLYLEVSAMQREALRQAEERQRAMQEGLDFAETPTDP